MTFLRIPLLAALAVGLAACGADDEVATADLDSDLSTETTLASTLSVPAGEYAIDPAHSGAEFRVRHLGISTVAGSFDGVDGTVSVGDDLSSFQTTAVIDASTIDTGNADRDEHLRSGDFFDIAQYPEITFTSTGIEPGEGDTFVLVGDLTMHGVTQPVRLEAEYLGSATDPWGNEKIGFTASGEIDRTDWGLNWNQALETGGVLVSDEVTLDIEVQATRQAAEEAAPEA